MRTVALLAVVTVASCVPPALFAQQEDEQTEEHRRRDEAYLERYREQQPAPAPSSDPSAVAQAYVERADALIRDRNHRSVETAHYRVQTDDPRLDVDAVGALLESFYAFFASRHWGATDDTHDARVRVFLFYSYYKYNQLVGGDWSRELLRPKGHYGSVFDALVIHTDSDRPDALANTVIHEAAHERIDATIYSGATRGSSWIREGLATYYENTLMEDGAFRPGRVGGKSVALMLDGAKRPASRAGDQLRLARQALGGAVREETPLSVTVMEADRPDEFYAGDIETTYAVSWVLVHFLLHGEDGRHTGAFREYVRRDAEGRAVPRELLVALGMDAAELDAALLRHVKAIRVR